MTAARCKKVVDDDDDDHTPRVGRPPSPEPYGPPKPMPWQSAVIAKAVQTIIDSFDDAPQISPDARYFLQRTYYRREQFGGGGAGLVTVILRCILESDGNSDAIAEPAIIEAVASCCTSPRLPHDMRLLEAFDQLHLVSILQTMRSLSLFKGSSLGHYMGIALRNKLDAIFGLPADIPARPAKKRRAGRWVRPPSLSDEAWQAVLAPRKARRNELERANYAKHRPRQKSSQQPAAMAA
jgi:hypothetical protein